MCNLRHPVSGPDPNAAYTGAGPTSSDPSQNLGSSLDTSAPPPSTTTMQPTKFAKLLKVVMPIVQGGVAGMSADPRTQGGGMAAQNFFQQQLQNKLQRQALQNQTANIQSEQKWRQAESQRARAQAQGAGKIYYANDATGKRHAYKIGEDGQEQDLGVSPLADKFVTKDTDRGIFTIDQETGQGTPVTDMAPEETGGLPMPNESTTLPLHAPTKPQRPVVLGEGSEAVDPNTGKVVAKGQPKQFAPKTPKASTKPDPAKIETYAGALLKQFNGDGDKALSAVDGIKSLDPAAKATLRARIREMKRGVPGRKFSLSPAEMQKMAQTPAAQ
jgi:hypothetical protein